MFIDVFMYKSVCIEIYNIQSAKTHGDLNILSLFATGTHSRPAQPHPSCRLSLSAWIVFLYASEPEASRCLLASAACVCGRGPNGLSAPGSGP